METLMEDSKPVALEHSEFENRLESMRSRTPTFSADQYFYGAKLEIVQPKNHLKV